MTILSWRIVAKIFLRSQLYSVLFFGLLSTGLVYLYWGFPLSTLVKILLLYVAAYIFYALVFITIPPLTLRKMRPLLRKVERGQALENEEVISLTRLLLNYPGQTAVKIFIFYLAFLVCIVYLTPPTAALPETLFVLQQQQIYLLISGFVLASIENLLNFMSLEQLVFEGLSKLARDYPVILQDLSGYRRISLFTKIFLLVFVTILSGPLVVLGAVMVKLSISFPSIVGSSLVFTVLFAISTVAYTIFVTRFFTKTIATSLNHMVAWSQQVIRGERSGLFVITNDELYDVASSANHMVQNLDQLTTKVEQDKLLIEAERNKLSFILQYIDDGVLACDEEGRVVLANQAALTILGLEESGVLHRLVDEVVCLTSDHGRVLVGDKVKQTDSHQRHWRRRQLKLLRPSKAERYVDVYAVRPDAPESYGLNGILALHDVTEERELEQMKLDFVSMAAHELRTPITSLRGYLSVLVKTAEKKLSSDEKNSLARSIISGGQLSALVDNLLAVSRIERGQMKLDLAEASMSEILQGVIQNALGLAQQKSQKVTFLPPDEDLPNVMVDKFRISEVVTNLLANAINYTPEGGIITVTMERKGDHIVITTKDNGPGIPAEALPHLFTKFYRVSGSLSAQTKGTGLGLFISKEIVTAHHGKIWAESVEGQGAAFCFSLPLAKLTTVSLGHHLGPRVTTASR